MTEFCDSCGQEQPGDWFPEQSNMGYQVCDDCSGGDPNKAYEIEQDLELDRKMAKDD